MSEKLKPCPFCGGESVLKFEAFPASRRKWWYVSCAVEDYDCFGVNVEQDEQGGTTCNYSKKEDAIVAWNNRPTERAAREEVLELVLRIIMNAKVGAEIRQAYKERYGKG